MTIRTTLFAAFIAALALAPATPAAQAAEKSSGAKIESDGRAALRQLVAKVPAAKKLQQSAVAILVFPSITKAGLVIGGQYGEGVLLRGGKASGFYSTSGASYGMQMGAQKYGYAMFFMSDSAVASLDKMDGFEVGVGPSVVVMDEGMGKSTTTTTTQSDIYAFIFSQKGLMAGLGLQGNKISKLDK